MRNDETTVFSTASIFRLLPGWRGNLIVFGLLILIVLSYFFFQVQRTQKIFFAYARKHSRMLAEVVELNAKGALLSQASVEEILTLFLGNTARFIEYLDDIEPFSEEELTAFAQENGLDGIFIHRKNGVIAMGPPTWFQDAEIFCRKASADLRHFPDRHLYVAVRPLTRDKGCIGVGLKALAIEELEERIGLDRLLRTLTGLAGIQYVRLLSDAPASENAQVHFDPEALIYVNTDSGKVAEVRRPLGNKVLLVGLNARQFASRIRLIWEEFFLFAAVLALLGGFFSWLLYRYQQFYFRHIRLVERELAREREDAALGRSTAAIAHEIRNPMNAIGMGLQRLQMESVTLDNEERELVANMLQVLKRANGIVENMRIYASPLTLRLKRIFLGELVRDVLVLYRQRCKEQGIQLTLDIKEDRPVSGDRHLLSQAVENLIKNSIEAQPDGGFLFIGIDSQENEVKLWLENDGFSLPAHEADQILEPYYTTKTQGTGLGLAIVRKNVLAHGGGMAVSVEKQGVLRVTLWLPYLKETVGEGHADTHR